MGGNDGIIATGGASVVGNAVASGAKSMATVRDSGLRQVSDSQQASIQEIRDLLARLIDELGRSECPERAELIEAAEDASAELESATPRKGKLKLFAAGLASVVAGIAPLVSLAAAIEQAIRGL